MGSIFTCKVIAAGPTVDNPPDTPDNPVMLTMIDQRNEFQGNTDFYAADAMKQEILAVALAAISTGRLVSADVDPPPFSTDDDGRPIPPECYGLSILNS